MRKDEFASADLLEATVEPEHAPGAPSLPWILVEGSYFVTERGDPWTPIGQNDAISWSDFNGLFRRRNLPAVEGHMRWLTAHGVTCLRLMLEYAQVRHRYFERPVGVYPPNMVRLWDDMFELCEKHGLRILLTPFDTFWTWIKFRHHPYNRKNGGCLDDRSRLLLCPDTRARIKDRLSFAVERWGGSGALFAWDLWNEIHPAHAQGSADAFSEFIHDLSQHVRGLEMRLYGRTHPQTVSLFGPELWWKPDMPLQEPIFRHPDLDFASIHIYQEGTIDDPKDTVAPALAVGKIVRDALNEMPDGRPFFDSEHGPIHAFKDKHITLPEPFDDEYFRHMQWAHLASGAAGGGMRWPNRRPHVLTHGMRRAQLALSRFLPLIDWPRFRRVTLNGQLDISDRRVAGFGCADADQAVVWLLRTDTVQQNGMLDRNARPCIARVKLPGLVGRSFQITEWDTAEGAVLGSRAVTPAQDGLTFEVDLRTDVAIAVRRV